MVEVETYDPYTDTWTPASPALKYVSNFSAASCRARLYLVGSSACKYNALALQCYNPVTGGGHGPRGADMQGHQPLLPWLGVEQQGLKAGSRGPPPDPSLQRTVPLSGQAGGGPGDGWPQGCREQPVTGLLQMAAAASERMRQGRGAGAQGQGPRGWVTGTEPRPPPASGCRGREAESQGR